MKNPNAKNKKRIIVILSILLVLVIVAVFYVTQFIFPVTVVDFEHDTAELFGSIDSYKEEYNRIQNNTASEAQIFRTENPFPSDDQDKYVTVFFNLDLKCHSLFKQSVRGMLVDVADDSNMVYRENDFMPTVLSGNEAGTYAIWVLVYKGNLSEAEFLNLVYSQKINLYFTNITGTHKITVDLMDFLK